MRKIILIWALVLCFMFGKACSTELEGYSRHATLCLDSEKEYFSCQLNGGKTASLCGSPTVGIGEAVSSTLQYRFGTARRLNFQYPENISAASPVVFLGEYLKPYGENIELKSIWFYSSGIRHSIMVRNGDAYLAGAWIGIGHDFTRNKCRKKSIRDALMTIIPDLPPIPYR